MKKLLFSLMLIAGFTAVNAQTVLFEDDFESYTIANPNTGDGTQLPTGYTSYDVNGDSYNWGLSNPAHWTQPIGDIYSGNFMISVSYHTGPNVAVQADNIMVLPMISIPDGATDVVLSYFAGSGTDPDFYSETYDVIVTTENTQAAILAATPVFTETLSFQGGETKTVSLDDFAGQDVYISFYHRDTFDQWVLGIDDISVTMGEVSGGEYCIPDPLDCNDGDVIYNVTFAGINNDSDCSPDGYGDYTATVDPAEVMAGETYEISMDIGAGWYEKVSMWIDFDNNSTFDADERFDVVEGDTGGVFTNDITIPADAAEGTYRMRIYLSAAGSDGDYPQDPCVDEVNEIYGEIEDYLITVGEGGGPAEDCEQIFTGEATGGSGSSSPYMTANDIEVAANTQFALETISFDVVPLAGEVTTFDVYIYEDNNGPGDMVGAGHFGLTPASVTPNGMLFDLYPIYTVEVDLPTAEVLSGDTDGAKYWVSVIMGPSTTNQQVFWIFSAYDDASTSEPLYQSPDDGGTWAPYVDAETGEMAEAVMTVTGTCGELGTSDMDSFDFAYYPNPVKDELNITSQKLVQSVSVYNLAGQQISTQKLNVNNGKVSTRSLAPGVYVFRAVLDGGQVETFKVIKK